MPHPLPLAGRSHRLLALHLLFASLSCIWPLLAPQSLVAQGYRPVTPGDHRPTLPRGRQAHPGARDQDPSQPPRAGYRPTAPPRTVSPRSMAPSFTPPRLAPRSRDSLPVDLFERNQPRASTFDSFGHAPRRGIGDDERRSLRTSLDTPALPVDPEAWRGTLPAPQELISRRYRDPAIQSLVANLTPNAALELYAQTLQLAQDRHLSPPPLSKLVRRGLFNLVEALQNPDFHRALNLPGPPPQSREFTLTLAQSVDPDSIQSAQQALALLRDTMQSAQLALNLPPAVVALEFQYGLLESLDQFSAFLPPAALREQSAATQGTQSGIGVQIEVVPAGLRVVRLLPGSPAAAAGLALGDILTAADGRSLRGLDLASATALITGPEGTLVTLSVWRQGTVLAALRIPRQRLGTGTVSDVRLIDPQTAYLRLELFSQGSAGEIERALTQLGQQGMQGLILDLRGNPGGLLSSALEITRLFLAEGTVVSTRGRHPEDNLTETGTSARFGRLPLVVLVDSQSASASEIVAAALQENRRAAIVGETTYGKGTVQTLFPLRVEGAAVRLTTAQFYAPSGRPMAGVGVIPEFVTASGPESEATLLDTARQVLWSGREGPRQALPLTDLPG